MLFVDLKRSFVPIRKDEEADLEIGRTWGHKFAGWLDWKDLLEHRRVVLLAEASSGKSEEFRHQTEALVAQGKTAFFVRIEDLADEGFEAALEPSAVFAFINWRDNSADEEGWFFLDSVDEARLNHKSLEKALRHFAHEVSQGLERAHIYVSCRVSDWKGKDDRVAVERILPAWEKPVLPEPTGKDAALLDPIFKEHHAASRSFATKEEPECKLDALLVVQLVPLSAEQRSMLAGAAGIDRPDVFVDAIERNGLETLAERPGDLLDLAEYWTTNGCFGTLAEMTEHGVARKLSERDRFRPDNRDLSSDKARHGAERLAAALTLAKSFTLRAPGHDPDPTLAAGALDPMHVLDDWTDAERNALTRRGVFAPSTYGRIRFHHRGTQEYLMASWLDRLLQAGCPRAAVWDMIFAERYGIETLVPSLRAPAAWLALFQPNVRDEIIRREPLVLLRHGDPRSLPLESKERLLLTYASRHAAGEISNDSLDHRALWMFATPDLSSAIRESWAINNREDFRTDLLRLVREGTIHTCTDLAREAALDEKANDYLRIVALETIDACKDSEGLTSAARWLKKAAGRVNDRLCPSFAKLLFPQYLTVDELLDLIGTSPPPNEGSLSGFGHIIDELWNSCPGAERERLLMGIANLALSPPFKADYTRISARYHDLAESLIPIAKDTLTTLGNTETSEGLVRLLMAVERVDRYSPREDEGLSLQALVSGNTQLQRRLFWADVEETRLHGNRGENSPTRIWEIYFTGGAIWQLGPSDVAWLFQDLAERPLQADKQIALSAVVSILRDSGDLNAEIPRLRELVSGVAELEQDLDRYLAPLTEDEEVRRWRLETRRREREYGEQQQVKKASWVKFRDEIMADPSVLYDPVRLASWRAGASRLHNLSLWLQHKTKKSRVEASLQWRLLEEGFGREIAEAYHGGLQALWRVTPPERPKHTGDNGSVVKNTTILSFAGLGVEAAEDPDWTLRLTQAEAERAIQHGCQSEQGYPAWIEALVDRYPRIVLPTLRQTLRDEWSGRWGNRSDFFSHYGRTDRPIRGAVQNILFEIITGKESKYAEILDRSLSVLRRLELSEAQRRKIASLAVRRLHRACVAGDDKAMLSYLTMLFLVDADAATEKFVELVSGTSSPLSAARAVESFADLFGRESLIAAGALDRASVPSLEVLVCLAYRYVDPNDDRVRRGVYTPDARDKAEEARNSLLGALLKRPGADAYRAMRALAADPSFQLRAIRFNELARGKAEQDAEPPAWKPLEVLAFERYHVAPAKTGEALLKVVMGVLSDIEVSFANADATSRSLLKRANNEDEVQEWLAEQTNLRSQGRFHAYRESQVARGDKPDIIISSTAAQVEVAVEVKHGGMNWSVRDLERALTKQLAEDYLKPASRRHGILVVSYHGLRTWRSPDTRATLSFQDLIERLQTLAASVVKNKLGPVAVCAFGLDASGKRTDNRIAL